MPTLYSNIRMRFKIGILYEQKQKNIMRQHNFKS